MYDALDGSAKKAEMALELLYRQEPDSLTPPKYIAEGLKWLRDILERKNSGLLSNGGGEDD